MKTEEAKQIIQKIKNQQPHNVEFRGFNGRKNLTLSYKKAKDGSDNHFRYFCGNRSGGGGCKHTKINESQAMELLIAKGIGNRNENTY